MLITVFFFNDTATTEIYTLSLHDALPISFAVAPMPGAPALATSSATCTPTRSPSPPTNSDGDPVPDSVRIDLDRKSTRLNSSHLVISYAVFCLKKKNYTQAEQT